MRTGWRRRANKLITQMCHALRRCPPRMMDRVRVRTGDTGAHPFISVTQLIPLSSHPLRHSTSRQTPLRKPHPRSVRQSPLFPFSACLLSSTRAISFFLPFLLLLHFVWLNRGGEKKKKDGKWVYVFLGLCCDRIACPVTRALEDAPAFLCKTRMPWEVMHSKFWFKSPRSPPPTPLPLWYYCWRCLKTGGSLSVFHRIATTNNTESLFIHFINKGDMKAGFNAYERVLGSHSSFTLIRLEVKKKSAPKAKALI